MLELWAAKTMRSVKWLDANIKSRPGRNSARALRAFLRQPHFTKYYKRIGTQEQMP